MLDTTASEVQGPGAQSGTNLPGALDPLFGREDLLEHIQDLLRRPGVRLITLTGAGGTGKTRLALELAALHGNHYADGAVFTGLASLASPDQVPLAIAQALSIRETTVASIAELLPVALRECNLLLVLDNFEHVLDAAPLVARLLDTCPQLTILVTSRAPLRLALEHDVHVPPLPLPAPATQDEMSNLAGNAAIRLFATQARKLVPEFTLTPANAQAIAMICHRLDGLPLAIKLAAGRSRVLDPVAMLARLEQRLPLLTTDQRDAPVRQRTMRDAIAWSYDLLREQEQALFRRLTIFTGGFSLELAEIFCQALETRQPAGFDLDVLEVLIDQHLIDREQCDHGDTRFTILETIREFALDQLALANELDVVRTAHASACIEWAERTRPHLFESEQDLWMTRSELEQPNIQLALDWALTHHDATSAYRLAAANGPYWLRQARYREALAWLNRAFTLPEPGPTQAVMFCHLIISAAAFHTDQSKSALTHVHSALELSQEAGDLEGESIARTMIAHNLLNIDLDAAERSTEEAYTLLQSLPASRELAPCLQMRAVIAGRRGYDDRFATLAKEAYEYAVSIGDWFHVVDALLIRAEAAWRQRLFGEALGHLEEAIRHAPTADANPLLTLVILDAALLAHARGDLDRALRWAVAGRMADESIGYYPDREYPTQLTRIFNDAREAIGPAATRAGEGAAHQLSLVDAADEVHAYRLAIQEASPASTVLTSRETEVLRLVAAGHTDTRIAETLFIARATASRHVSNILAKLDVSSRTAAVDHAYRLGLLERPSPSPADNHHTYM